ncbi:MAG: radical SAM protein, partial [Candidatus Fimadaptatus sp.]
MAALYIHIPFCAGKCAYCDFVSYAGRRHDMARYLSAVKRELAARAGELAGQSVDTVYIGGGTPTFMGAQALGGIMDAVRASYALGPECEVSCEANPGTVTRAELEALRAAGINRLSLGVQAAQDGLLRA